ncbi:3'-5' exonuclease [Paenibacillus sp. PR3]|uniref:3'-5' exonuclease n=1 Tax=Paenibacillus terricola TaxID=2763503 RepID=A0ABR8MV62_9BACL|nr:3'-5' exonuclease [Paenibacillus terricola]MBD3919856.1 3'-5' exonuclease [Paenibacillus terricola]
MKIDMVSETEYIISEFMLENIRAQTYCVFDLEATGPNEEEDDVIQIGAVLLNGRSGEIEKTYETLVKPSKLIPKAIEGLTGISNEDVNEAPEFTEAFTEFSNFSEGAVLVTQAGYEFDWPLLMNECSRNHLRIISNKIMDTKVLFAYLFPEISEIISTNFLIKTLNIDDYDIKRHHALGDSVLIARIFMELMRVMSNREIDEITIQHPITIKRVQLQKLL